MQHSNRQTFKRCNILIPKFLNLEMQYSNHQTFKRCNILIPKYLNLEISIF